MNIRPTLARAAAVALTIPLAFTLAGVPAAHASSFGSSSAAVSQEPKELRDFKAAAARALERQGFTVTTEANRFAQDLADSYGNSQNVQYPPNFSDADGGTLSGAGVIARTQQYNQLANEYPQQPSNGRTAGVGIEGGPVMYTYFIVFLD